MSLQLHSDSSGLRHFLNSKQVNSGDVLEILVKDKWIRVRYEWSRRLDHDAYGLVDDSDSMPLKSHTQVRWPE
jgi:hypothetical protein